jgi:hypothetical protein
MIAPYQLVCRSRVSASDPMSLGRTGTMSPMPSASRKTQARTNPIAGFLIMGQGRGKKLTKIQYYRESQGGAEGAEGLPQAGEAGLSLGGTYPVALMRINSCKSD